MNARAHSLPPPGLTPNPHTTLQEKGFSIPCPKESSLPILLNNNNNFCHEKNKKYFWVGYGEGGDIQP